MRTGPRFTLRRALAALSLAAACLVGPEAAYSQARFDTAAPTALLIDYDTGTVLFDKEADKAVPPASLTKLMTLEVLFHMLQEGKVHPDDTFSVSEHAWRSGGPRSGSSTMFLRPGETVKVDDLIQGVAVQSGNDAAVTIAEGLAGTEAAFADMMNARAKTIGLTHSHFANPHGLPDPNEYVTMRDMVRLAAHLIRTYPDRYPVFSEAEFSYNKVRQHNRNPTLTEVEGADGLKTGHTEESGYSLVASAQREGRRLILAMSGLKSARERAQEARKILDYGFRAFEVATVAKAGAPVGNAPVSGGATDAVPLVPREPVSVVVARSEGTDHLAEKIVVDHPAAAPVKEGDRIATLRVVRRDGDRESVLREVPLYAGASIEQGTIVQRAWETATGFMMQQWQTILGVVQNGISVTTGGPADHPAERQT